MGEKLTYAYEGQVCKYLDLNRQNDSAWMWFHGAMIEASTYSKALGLWARNYRVIAPDMPGFGDSPAPTEIWGWSDYAKYFSRMMKEMGWKNVVAAGHSFGGGVAAHLAAENKQVSRLVLIDPAGVTDKPWGHFQQAVMEKMVKDWQENPQMTLRINRDAIADFLGKHPTNIPGMMKIIKRAITRKELELGNVDVPTLIMWGDKDEVLDPGLIQEWKKTIPQAVIKIVPGNHDWCLFKPETMVENAEDFVRETIPHPSSPSQEKRET